MPTCDDERELARRARGGDRDALRDLARAWWPRMRRWALLELGDPTLAEDACQEALVRLIRSCHTLDDRPIEPWLRAIVRNAARDVRAARRPTEPVGDPGVEPRADRDLDLRRTAAAALAAFAQLTPRQREVVDLCDRQDLSPTEAASRLDIAPGTARALLHQGRRALREALLLRLGAEVLDLLRRNSA